MTSKLKALARRAKGHESVDMRVEVGDSRFPVTRFSDKGFVITAAGRPPLRGFADIFMGENLVRHGLVTVAWHEGDQVAYEFKHATQAQPMAPDYASLT